MYTKRNRRFKGKRHHLADLSMTPLIDVALTLLIMFMVATPLIHNAVKVTLPKGNVQENTKNESDEIIVYIDKNGDFYLNGSTINRSDLIAQIKEMVGTNTEKTVYVKADTDVSYGTVLELVDTIKFVGGIKYVALATQKTKK